MSAPTTGRRLPLGAELRRQREAGKGSAAVPFSSWAMRVPEPKAGPLDFDAYPFQRELYENADDREAVVEKGTQVGVSAFLLRWVLFWADAGKTALYVFPRRKQMYDFADARVDPAIRRSKYLAGRVGRGGHAASTGQKPVDNKGLKVIGPGFVYFRGSESEDDLDSVDADVLAMDEYDRLKPANIPVAERRISGEQSLGLMRRVGVPTVPNFGIGRLYQLSDRRRWLVRCRCGLEQRLTWADNIDTERRLRVCRKCHRELRPEDVAAGRWAAEASDVAVRGYHIPKLIQPRIDVGKLVDASEKPLPEDKQAFWNRDLAEPYAPEEGRLSPEAIAAAMSVGERGGVQALSVVGPGYRGYGSQGYRGLAPTTMGVDAASTRRLNVRVSELFDPVGGRKRALFIGTADNFDALTDLMDLYQVSMATVDHLPDGRLSAAFAERFAGRAYQVAYSTNQEQVIAVKEDLRKITVRRVEAIDATFEAVRQQRNLLPPRVPEAEAGVPGYAEQMGNLVRMVERNAEGRRVVRYLSMGRDDYAHAEVYDLVAGAAWRIRLQVAEAEADHITTLDDHMEFERTSLHDEADVGSYDDGPGPDDAEYADGFGDDDGDF